MYRPPCSALTQTSQGQQPISQYLRRQPLSLPASSPRYAHVEAAAGDERDVDGGAADAAERVRHAATVLDVGRKVLERVELVRERGRRPRRAVLDADAAGQRRAPPAQTYSACPSEVSGLGLPVSGRRIFSFMNAPRPLAAEYCARQGRRVVRVGGESGWWERVGGSGWVGASGSGWERPRTPGTMCSQHLSSRETLLALRCRRHVRRSRVRSRRETSRSPQATLGGRPSIRTRTHQLVHEGVIHHADNRDAADGESDRGAHHGEAMNLSLARASAHAWTHKVGGAVDGAKVKGAQYWATHSTRGQLRTVTGTYQSRSGRL